MTDDKYLVTLIRSPIVSTTRAVNNEATPCVAFAYLSAYLQSKGYRAHVVDGIAEALNRVWPLPEFPGYQCHGLTFDEVVERIPAQTRVIGFSTMFSGEWPVVRTLIRAVRRRFPEALIVAGGEHITALTEYSMRDCPEIDVCVCGEGERALYEICEAYRDGRDFAAVAGAAYLDRDGALVEIAAERIREVSELAWPVWPDGYMERFWAAGKSYGVQTARDMPIIASRGCPYRCTFCSNPRMWTTRYILRDIDDLIGEIKSYVARYDITALQFYDLTAVTKKRWTLEFCQRLIDEGLDYLKWSLPSGTRSEALDSETLAMLKRTNCNYLVYAPESGSPETLVKIKKRIELASLTQSVLEAKRQGIVVRTNLIIGFPHETRRNVFQTIRYGLYLAWKGADEVTINIFSPYPGTEIFADLLAKKKLTLGDDYFLALTSLNSDYTMFNPLTCNDQLSSRELAIYRIGFMLLNYSVGYIRFPSRIVRTIRNIFFGGGAAATVFEHRIKDARKKAAARRVGTQAVG
ncbi:MAG: Radical domain protein [Rhodospirillales bacterium]|jgi:anaerobic magnesium-protoporphyrin IX monomethyl ester cyclase|nr:Radical domain protein [Rhodospirillales bacterium]